jgi:hypothetical protein
MLTICDFLNRRDAELQEGFAEGLGNGLIEVFDQVICIFYAYT